MKRIIVKPNFKVEDVFNNYPDQVKAKMYFLRALVMETAEETASVTSLEETLRWGEPSFVSNNGSTFRMDWKKRTPDQYALYFQCTSRLVETFRMIFHHTFKYEGNRAIVFHVSQEIPVLELKECIKAALIYHSVKHLENLGINL